MAPPSKHSSSTSRWSLNRFVRLFHKKGSTPRPSLSSVFRETLVTQSGTVEGSDINVTAIWELPGMTANHSCDSSTLDMPPALPPTPLPHVSSTISVACGTTGHHNAHGPTDFPSSSPSPGHPIDHPIICQLMLFGKSLFFIQTQRETFSPEVELQTNVCQHHILQISTAALFIMQMLAVASVTPLSPLNVNVNLLSHQLVQLAESLNFLEGEVKFQLCCLNDLADPVAGITCTGSTGTGLDWQSTTITVDGDETLSWMGSESLPMAP